MIFDIIFKIMRIIFTYIISVFFIKVSYSQNYVCDKESKKPIESVHIKYNSNYGLVTNEDGFFDLSNSNAIDSLTFSHIGYESKRILIKNVKIKDTVFLEKKHIALEEVKVDGFDLRKTILSAIEKIDNNYLDTPHNSFGFFRQSLQEDSIGVEMIEVDFISYMNNSSSYSTKIRNARRTENYSKLGLETYGGVFGVIENGDFVRRKRNFLNPSNIDKYNFEYQGKMVYKDLIVYKVNFKPISKDVSYIRLGTFYLDSKSLAFVEINYSFDKEKLNYLINNSNNVNYKKPYYNKKEINNIIRYKKLDNDKWVLSYIETNNLIEGIYKNEKYNYKLTAKLVVNNVKIENTIPVKTNYKISKDFSKAIRRFDSLQGWNDNYKLSLSENDRRILKNIDEKKEKK